MQSVLLLLLISVVTRRVVETSPDLPTSPRVCPCSTSKASRVAAFLCRAVWVAQDRALQVGDGSRSCPIGSGRPANRMAITRVRCWQSAVKRRGRDKHRGIRPISGYAALAWILLVAVPLERLAGSQYPHRAPCHECRHRAVRDCCRTENHHCDQQAFLADDKRAQGRSVAELRG
jgi:hypothetical protein